MRGSALTHPRSPSVSRWRFFNLRSFLHRLSERERIVIVLGALFVLSTLLYSLVLSPALERRDRWQSMAVRKKQELARFEELKTRYMELTQSLSGFEKRIGSSRDEGSLLARLESGARESGVQDKIASMKPLKTQMESGIEESSVEIRLEKLDLGSLVGFLKNVENENRLVRTRRIRIKARFDDPKLLDVTLLVSTLEGK